MTDSCKKHNSCVRVLEFLKLLLNKEVDLKELTMSEISEFREIEATETFLKYIGTLEFSGLEIQKNDKKYSVTSGLVNTDFNDDEINLLAEICERFDYCCTKNNREVFEKTIQKITTYMKESSKTKFLDKIKKHNKKNNFSEIAEKFQKYVDLGQKVKITYNGQTINADPKDVEIENQKIYFIVYNPVKARKIKILTDSIENIEILPVRTTPLNMTETIVFEVYDRLAVNYRLREWEKMQTFSDDRKIIVNCGEDRKLLLQRLLKYGENCKIISPNSLKEEYLQELDKIEARIKEAVL